MLARQAGADVYVVDMGVAADLEPGPDLFDHKVAPWYVGPGDRPGDDPRRGRAGLLAGVAVAERLVDAGYDCLLTGDMGIANTTPSAALVAALTGVGTRPRDRPRHRRRRRHAGAARSRWSRPRCWTGPPADDPVETLASLGGFEHAGLAGFVLGAASRGVPVILDGVIAGVRRAGRRRRWRPEAVGYCFAGHRSVEPGHASRWTSSGCGRWWTSTCGSARAPARCWRSRRGGCRRAAARDGHLRLGRCDPQGVAA